MITKGNQRSFDTRGTEFFSTKIDLLYSTSDQVKTKCLNSCNITDHETRIFCAGGKRRMRLTINVTCWEYYNDDNLMALLRLIKLKWYDHELRHLNRKKYELLYIDKRTGEWTEYNIIIYNKNGIQKTNKNQKETIFRKQNHLGG